MENKDRPPWLLRCPDIPLEVVILSVGGLVLAEAAILLAVSSAAQLPYYENGFYGLLLVIFALQMVAMGKTPIGDLSRSPKLLMIGGFIAAIGIIACCIPSFQNFPRSMVLIYLGGGGMIQLVRLFPDKDKIRHWLNRGALFRQLIFACNSVYLLSILIALALWQDRYLPDTVLMILVLLVAGSLFYLAWLLQKIHQSQPLAKQAATEGIDLSAAESILLLLAIFMSLLGLLLLPVGVGLLPFSASAQIGLLMVFFSLQMLTAGQTPIGSFPRNWLMMACGFLFAGAGIISCMIPELILQPLTRLIGILNIANGSITLRSCFQMFRTGLTKVPPSFRKTQIQLLRVQSLLGLLNVLFGSSMLLPGLVPTLVTGMILFANGLAMLFLVRLLVRIHSL